MSIGKFKDLVKWYMLFIVFKDIWFLYIISFFVVFFKCFVIFLKFFLDRDVFLWIVDIYDLLCFFWFYKFLIDKSGIIGLCKGMLMCIGLFGIVWVVWIVFEVIVWI